ncbi:hypothetical protein KC614_03880 [candidate division WWE3 bacterium]|uniref:Band 7 domain-containing protein n=1 Tax=candidate division WWE3 bacterium TaxID=2053526 RepID=A0A955LLZ2_UNCKA|nr:hypothetical protein [candidate division WWE3 bacterium]
MKIRIVLTVVIAALWGLLQWVWSMAYTATQAQSAILQLQDNPIVYGTSRWFVSGDRISPLFTSFFALLLVATWARPVLRKLREVKLANGLIPVLILGFVAISATGCVKPPRIEPIEEIAPNETAFVIPLEGATDSQAQFASEQYLRDHQVATKRIVIPVRERKIGRYGWQIEWIPTVRVIRVDRTPVSRIWSPGADQDSNGKDEGFRVESFESVGFTVGIASTGIVYEEDAARFLYYFSGKTLQEVMDDNVYNYVQQQLFDEFAALPVMDAVGKKNAVLERVHADTEAYFKPKGLTIESLGGQGGLVFDDDEIQNAIDAILVAEQAEEVAIKEQAAVKVTNETSKITAQNLAQIEAIRAEGEANAALIKARAEAEAILLKGDALRQSPGFTAQTIAERSRGLVPGTLIVTSDNASQLPFIWQLPATDQTVQPSVPAE